MHASSNLERVPRLRSAQVALGVAAALTMASAAAVPPGEEGLGVVGAIEVLRDDNIFRLPDNVDPQVALGAPSKADTYGTASLNAHFDTSVSAQRFVGEATVSEQRFKEFDYLNHSAYSGNVAWLWRAGSRFDGRFGYDARKFMIALGTLFGGVLSTTPNYLTSREATAAAGYGAQGPVRLRGEYSHLERRNKNFATASMDRDAIEVTLSYVSTAENSIGIAVRHEDATLPTLLSFGGLIIDSSYKQERIAAVLDWTPVVQSRLRIIAGHNERNYRQFPQRDYKGWMYDVNYDWLPADRFTLTAFARRGLSVDEQVDIGHVVLEAFGLRPGWQITDKTYFTLNAEQNTRTSAGNPRLGLNFPSLKEKVWLAGMNLTYQATPHFRFAVLYRHEARDMHAVPAEYDYKANVAGLEFRAVF